MSPIITPGGSGGGGSQPVTTVVQAVTFASFAVVGGAWPGQAPYMTIQPTQVVLNCVIVVTQAFNDSGLPAEIQITNDPDGPGEAQLSNSPDPKTTAVTNGIAYPGHVLNPAAGPFPYQPNPAAITPVIAMQVGWNGDGTTGRALIFTTIYTP